MITDELATNKYVAFLDVLGFKELVYGSSNRLDLYFKTMEESLLKMRVDKASIEAVLISDSTILACADEIDHLRMLLTAIQTIQVELALQNIWIRGGLSIGSAHFSMKDASTVVVGKGLIEAYQMEQRANYPRVIIDPKVVSNFGDKETFLQKFNQDGQHALVYGPPPLAMLIADTSCFFVSFARRLISRGEVAINQVYEHIKGALYSSQATFGKYLWLKEHFSTVLSTLAHSDKHRVSKTDESRMLKNAADKFKNL